MIIRIFKSLLFVFFNMAMLSTICEFLISDEASKFLMGLIAIPILVIVDFRLCKMFWPDSHR